MFNVVLVGWLDLFLSVSQCPGAHAPAGHADSFYSISRVGRAGLFKSPGFIVCSLPIKG